MKKLSLPTGRTRNVVTLALVIALALILLLVNLLFPLAMHRWNWYVDLTPEGLYTLTDALEKELEGIEEDVEIIFCADWDYLISDDETRYPYIMCKKLAARNDRISLRYIDVLSDPNAADAYKSTLATEIHWNDVIVSAGGSYKILAAKSFYTSADGEYVSYNGEYRIATAILSLTAYKDGPAAYFTYGHGERYYIEGDEGSDPELSAFASLLGDLGLRVGKIDLDAATELPEDCVLLIMVDPSEDYSDGNIYDYGYTSSLEKIDKYLAARNTFMVFRDALSEPMPCLNEYLEEWGFTIDQTHVTSPDDSLVSTTAGKKDGDRLVAVYPDANSAAIGHSMMSAIADLATPPKTVLANAASVTMTWKENLVYVANNTSRCVSAVFYAGEKATARDADGYVYPSKDGVHWLAAVSAEARLVGGEHEYSYVFGAGSTKMISNEYLTDPSFGNADVMFSVLRFISRTDVYASGALGGSDPNARNEEGEMTYGGKMFDQTHLTYGEENIVNHTITKYDTYKGLSTGALVTVCILVSIPPVLAVPAAAFYVLRRRKHR